VGLPFRPDHAAEDARHRKLGMACLVVCAAVTLVAAVCCGGAIAWQLM
jgi:hypothetical protein